MKIAYAAVLILSMILSATSAFGRELEDLEAGAEVQSKAKPGTTYRVQEVTPRGVWVTIPRRGGIRGALEGDRGRSGTKRIFIPRDTVAGVEPLAPIGPKDLTGEDGYARLREILQDDVSAADRAADLDAAALWAPLRERETQLRKLRQETQDPALRALLDDHFRDQAPMPNFVRRAAVEQLWESGRKDAAGATGKAWDLTLDALAAGAEEDVKELAGVRGALERKTIDELAAGIDRDRAGTHRRATEALKRFGARLKGLKEDDLPPGMTRFLEDLQGASDASRPNGPSYSAGPPSGPNGPSDSAGPPSGPIGPSYSAGPPSNAPLDPELRAALPEIPALPAPKGGPQAPEPVEREAPAELEAKIDKILEDSSSAEPEDLQAQLLEAEAEILEQQPALADAQLNPSLTRVRAMLRDANRHLQRISGEALESDPVAFTKELLERGAAYERALRRLPRKLRDGYRGALRQIGGLLDRARAAARAKAQPLTPLQGARQIRELRERRAEAIAQGLTGLANQLRRQEAEVQRRIK